MKTRAYAAISFKIAAAESNSLAADHRPVLKHCFHRLVMAKTSEHVAALPSIEHSWDEQKVSFPGREKSCSVNKKSVVHYTKNNFLTPFPDAMASDDSRRPNPWHCIVSG
jgi:hypothetical protein